MLNLANQIDDEFVQAAIWSADAFNDPSGQLFALMIARSEVVLAKKRERQRDWAHWKRLANRKIRLRECLYCGRKMIELVEATGRPRLYCCDTHRWRAFIERATNAKKMAAASKSSRKSAKQVFQELKSKRVQKAATKAEITSARPQTKRVDR